MANDLAKAAKDRGIKYFLISFVDLLGVLRAKLVPASAIAEMQENGAGFAGFATWLDMTPAHPDMFAMPDPASLIQLPWQPDVGWLAADLWMDGKEVEASPRAALKRQIEAAAKDGWRMKTGVECEYFLLAADGRALADARDTQEKPCYDQSALMRRYPVITEICDAMLALGWGAYQNDHEDANGQFEMNWAYDDALVTADRHVFFKYMVKTLAEKHGLQRHLHAQAVPPPHRQWLPRARLDLGRGRQAQPVPRARRTRLGLSPLAYHFLGGIMHGADELCAVFNPTVNSYKRINAPRTLSGATWAPNAVSYSGNNRTHMIRIPDAGRLELRLLDGSANPYLAQAAILMLGGDGMRTRRDPGPRLDCNMYTEGHLHPELKRLPLNLLDAIRAFESSAVARAGLGEELVGSYAKLKHDEWDRYCNVVTDWERETTLDC